MRHDDAMPRFRAGVALLLSLLVIACSGALQPGGIGVPSRAPGRAEGPDALHGRVERHGDLRVLRLWGTPAERGYAHGRLLGDEMVAVLSAELSARFARRRALLEQVRSALPRLIEYPEDIAIELDALWQGVLDAGVARRMPDLERDLDKTDLLVANALDVFGLMGCSSFTVWGERAAGGGVLTARNFDWPFTGDHLLDSTILIVQELANGSAVASVAWPGYVGTVTGVSRDGMAAYLHVGSAKISLTPEPSSWPSAIATRRILRHGPAKGAEHVYRNAVELLEYTSPPVGFLTHVVLPAVPKNESPFAVFEADTKDCVRSDLRGDACVLTNHFLTREDGRRASSDSKERRVIVSDGIKRCFAAEDRRVDVDEAWQLLSKVERGGGHDFGTLHSLVFRHQPWHFELRLADHRQDGLVAAPSSTKRIVLTREQVFGDGPR